MLERLSEKMVVKEAEKILREYSTTEYQTSWTPAERWQMVAWYMLGTVGGLSGASMLTNVPESYLRPDPTSRHKEV